MSVLEAVRSSLKREIVAAIEAAGLAAGSEVPETALEVPKDKAHGDFATNAAMQLTRIAKKNPRQIAESLIASLDLEKAGVQRAEIAGPGFINFFMDKRFLHRVIRDVHAAGAEYGRVELGRGQTVQVEFVSANPTGSLHLGHARGAAFGDALCNLLALAGYQPTREYYINDAGNQVENLVRSIEARYEQALGRETETPEDGYHGADIIGFAEQLVQLEGDRIAGLPEAERRAFFRQYGLNAELAKLRRDLERFGVHFDVWYSETSLYENGKIDEALALLKQNNQVYEEDGAVWLNTMPYGDDKNRVLIKNDGTYTYLTPDIAYHKDKYERGFDHMINIWGADHHGYIARVKAAMQALGYDAGKLTVLIGQMVSLFQGGEKVKMSKRTGKAVTMEDLMDEVGVDATRYFFAMRSIDSHLDFDMDLAVSQSNENPVFYVQYAHARICSVFRQAAEQSVEVIAPEAVNLERLTEEAEYDLLLKLAELPDEVAQAAAQYAPHRLVRYVYELASQFHSYYRSFRFITEDAELSQARLALAGAVGITLRNVLRLIGVSAPESM